MKGWGGREETWELCGTQAHMPLAAGSVGPKVASEGPEEAQALLVLQHWPEMPELGIQLVPEHIEMRSLYYPHSQGLLQVREGLALTPERQDSHLVLDCGSQDALSPRPLGGHYTLPLLILILVPSIPTAVVNHPKTLP